MTKHRQPVFWPHILLLLILLTGCQLHSESGVPLQPVKGVIALYPQETSEDDNPQSHSTTLGTHPTKNSGEESLVYTLEVWTREAQPQCLLHQTQNGTLTAGAEFELALLPNTYDILLWADYGNGHYRTTNLREVALSTLAYSPDATNDAFAAALQQVEWDGSPFQAILKRPLARLNIHQGEAFTQAETVTVTYHEIPTSYDVLTGEASKPQQNVIIAFPETTPGSTLVCGDFLLVPASGILSLDLSVGSVTKTLENIPLKTNYNTNITGTF